MRCQTRTRVPKTKFSATAKMACLARAPRMVIDTSALVAIFLGARTQAVSRAHSSGRDEADFSGELETGIVLEARRGEAAGREFDLFVVRAKLEVVPVDAEQVEIARSAWRKYGKGRHAAGLNFGDCFAYALAKFSGQELLARRRGFSVYRRGTGSVTGDSLRAAAPA
jgi:ribonuclease VapC